MKNLPVLLTIVSLNITSICGTQPGYFEPWGKDSEIIKKEETKEILEKPTIFSWTAQKIIKFHQNNFSPIQGPRSNYRPTSSRYMQLAISRYGFFKGFIMGCDRLLRENSEEWVYRTIEIDGVHYKYDPARVDKF